MSETAESLKGARATEPALRNSVNSIINAVERYELRNMDNIRKYAVRQADRFLKELSEVVDTIAKIGAEEIKDGEARNTINNVSSI